MLDVDIDTGKKWIDGKTIYRIVRYIWHNMSPTTNYTMSGHILTGPITNNADTIISFGGIIENMQNQWATVFSLGENSSPNGNAWHSDTSAYINYGAYVADEYLIIEYTKTTD